MFNYQLKYHTIKVELNWLTFIDGTGVELSLGVLDDDDDAVLELAEGWSWRMCLMV